MLLPKITITKDGFYIKADSNSPDHISPLISSCSQAISAVVKILQRQTEISKKAARCRAQKIISDSQIEQEHNL